jgi:hypothetical protein
MMTMFRFTIRELFFVTILSAPGLGWWVDHRKLQSEKVVLTEKAWMWRDRTHAVAYGVAKHFRVDWDEYKTVVTDREGCTEFHWTPPYDWKLPIEKQRVLQDYLGCPYPWTD